jgi:hypothetical protein
MSISYTVGEECTLTDLATNKILEYCDCGKNWVNSDFLWFLDQHIQKEFNEEFFQSHYIWGDWHDFVTFERSIENGWSDMVSWFKEQNPKLKDFLDFYEKNIIHKKNLKTECEGEHELERDVEYIGFFKRTLIPTKDEKSQPKSKIEIFDDCHQQMSDLTFNTDNEIPF